MGGARGAAVAISGLAKRFPAGGTPIVAVDDVTFDVAPGAVLAVTGPSGSTGQPATPPPVPRPTGQPGAPPSRRPQTTTRSGQRRYPATIEA
jgi:hypothetical protein